MEGELDLPWPPYRKFYKFVERKKHNIRAQCKLCLPNIKVFSCSVTASSNLRKHLAVVHPKRLLELPNIRKGCKKRNGSIEIPECVGTSIASEVFDGLLVNFVIDGLQPLAICDPTSSSGAAFRKLVRGLLSDPTRNVMCVQTLKTRLQSLWRNTKSELVNKLSDVEFVAITIDYWAAPKRCFVGIAAHWINPTTLDREYAALACSQLKPYHTLKDFSSALKTVVDDYSIQNKISGITTDNGLNFLTDSFGKCKDRPIFNSRVTFIEVTGIVSELGIHNYRCASRTLDLVFIRGMEEQMKIPEYRSDFTKIFETSSASSILAVSFLKETVNTHLKASKGSGWVSHFYALKKLTEQEDISKICDYLEVTKFTRRELTVLKEYVAILKPLCFALDILKNRSSMYGGYLLPTLHKMVAHLEEIKNAKYCLPLLRAIISEISLRFQSVWWKREFVIAACVHPKFKMYWIQDKEKKDEATRWIVEELELRQKESNPVEVQMNDETPCKDFIDEDFFQFSASIPISADDGSSSLLNSFLGNRNRNVSLLNSYGEIKKLFIQYNTSIPASAAVSDMFSANTYPFKTERFDLADEMFEAQLLLNLNSKYRLEI